MSEIFVYHSIYSSVFEFVSCLAIKAKLSLTRGGSEQRNRNGNTELVKVSDGYQKCQSGQTSVTCEGETSTKRMITSGKVHKQIGWKYNMVKRETKLKIECFNSSEKVNE